jgi:hypothetical protein
VRRLERRDLHSVQCMTTPTTPHIHAAAAALPSGAE